MLWLALHYLFYTGVKTAVEYKDALATFAYTQSLRANLGIKTVGLFIYDFL